MAFFGRGAKKEEGTAFGFDSAARLATLRGAKKEFACFLAAVFVGTAFLAFLDVASVGGWGEASGEIGCFLDTIVAVAVAVAVAVVVVVVDVEAVFVVSVFVAAAALFSGRCCSG